ncbi:unnamed protein product, partial [Amoebophrya sp. A25]
LDVARRSARGERIVDEDQVLAQQDAKLQGQKSKEAESVGCLQNIAEKMKTSRLQELLLGRADLHGSPSSTSSPQDRAPYCV